MMVLKEFGLEGKVAIVTGAGRGIGKEISLALAEAGANIVAVSRTHSEIEQTVKDVQQMGSLGIAVPADVTKAADVSMMVDKAVSKFSRLDILVNQAGMGGGRKPLVPLPGYNPPGAEGIADFSEPINEGMWHQIIDTNLTSIFLCTRAVGPHMIEQKKGKIINMSSFVGAKGFPYELVYSTSKAAVSMFTRSLALEWARYNINVNAIGPGYVRTALTERFFKDDAVRERLLRSIPLKRLCEPREVGLLVVFLSSDASNYLTGQTIYLDGGLLA